MENTEQKTCQVLMYEDEPCGRSLYDGEKCICHSEKEDKDVKLFQAELDKIFAGDEEAEYYDLTEFIFPKEGCRLPKEYKKDTHFYSATFSGEADFFIATFSRKADFNYAKFSGKAVFSGATFSGEAEFVRATFSGDARFVQAVFSGKAYFEEATFSEDADFYDATFSEGAYFSLATFSAKADFFRAAFSGRTEFRSTLFKKLVSFSHCEVSKEAVVAFDGEELQKHEKKEMFPAGADFTSWALVEPKNIKFRKLSLEKCEFLETDVTEVQFVDVTWARKPKFFKWFPRNAVHDEFSRKPDYNLIAQLYRRLQANYVSNYRYSEAGGFYIGEQEMIRKAEGKVGQYLSTNNAYRIISYYGQSFKLPLFWLAFVLLLFPAVLLYDGVNLNPTVQDPAVVETVNYEWSWSPGDFLPVNGDSRRAYWEAFAANFSLIAYSRSDIGKYLPESHTRFIVTIESLIVIALLAFFLLALRRKYKRKTF